MKFARYEYIKATFSVFSFSMLQDFISILRVMGEHDVDLSELAEYIMENQKIFTEENAKDSISNIAATKYCVCPECGKGIVIEGLNSSPNSVLNETDEEGRKYLSMATCRDERKCGWQRFSHLSVTFLVRSFFPEKVNESLKELTRQPHGMEGI
jgi:hypothetical protein